MLITCCEASHISTVLIIEGTFNTLLRLYQVNYFKIIFPQVNELKKRLYMRESVRKIGLIGAGLWAMTEDKINELVKDLVDKGDISKEEGKKAVQELIDESKKQTIDLEKKVSEKIQDAMSKKEIFTGKDMNELESRIKDLEEEIRRIKNKENMFFK